MSHGLDLQELDRRERRAIDERKLERKAKQNPGHGVLCPQCGGNDQIVVDSRDTEGGIRRRRECKRCGKRITTLEHEVDDARVTTQNDVIREARKMVLRVLANLPRPTLASEKKEVEAAQSIVLGGSSDIRPDEGDSPGLVEPGAAQTEPRGKPVDEDGDFKRWVES